METGGRLRIWCCFESAAFENKKLLCYRFGTRCFKSVYDLSQKPEFYRRCDNEDRDGITLSNATTVHAPVIQEAFINMECTLKEIQDLSGAGITAMVIGQVQHISVDEKYAQGYKQRYGKDGFMMLIPAPQDLVTGEPNQSAIATVNIEKYD